MKRLGKKGRKFLEHHRRKEWHRKRKILGRQIWNAKVHILDENPFRVFISRVDLELAAQSRLLGEGVSYLLQLPPCLVFQIGIYRIPPVALLATRLQTLEPTWDLSLVFKTAVEYRLGGTTAVLL